MKGKRPSHIEDSVLASYLPIPDESKGQRTKACLKRIETFIAK